MPKKGLTTALAAISIYCLIHGVFYILGSLLLSHFGIWHASLTFLFGNVTISSMPVVPIILGAIYILVGCCLMFRMHWARLALLMLCIQSIFFEFPIGSLLSLSIIFYSFTPLFSRLFSQTIKKKVYYYVAGFLVILIGILMIISISGISTNVTKFASFQLQGFELSSASPESKIKSIEQKVGIIDVLLELTGSPDSALEQQDIVLGEIAPYVVKVVSRFSQTSNSLIITVEASNLLKIAENNNIENVYPIEPSFQFLPYELTDAEAINFAPLQLDVSNLWQNGVTGKGVTIAVMDTGIKEDHPDLQRNGKSIVVGSLHLHGEYVYEHGTMVASCIANQNPNYKGIAPDVNILNVEVFRWETKGGVQYLTATNADILQGFEFVASWKKLTGDYIILSCSWGVSAQAWAHDADITVAAANRLATEYNIPVIAAAGNSGPGSRGDYVSIPYQIMSPAGGKNVLSVGAIDNQNNIASFSSRGPYYDGIDKPDVVAPGVNVPVLDYTGITTASGTSFACPYVSAVAALLAQNHKDMSSSQLYDAICKGATDLGSEGYDLEYGYGIVDAEKSQSYIEQAVTSENFILLCIGSIVIGIIILVYPSLQKRKK